MDLTYIDTSRYANLIDGLHNLVMFDLGWNSHYTVAAEIGHKAG